MAEKYSVKTVSTIFLLCTVVLALCAACIEPVNLNNLIHDPIVEKLIASSKETVQLDKDSDPGLIVGYRMISGLDPEKYYMIEKETDRNGAVIDPDKHPMYIIDDPLYGKGRQVNYLGMITRIAEGKINGLDNYHTYTVKSAKPFASTDVDLPLNIPYTVDGVTTPKTVTNGVLTVNRGINGTGKLDLSAVINNGYYEVMAVSVDDPENSPWNRNSKSTDPDNNSYVPALNWASFGLESSGTFDYVFVKIGAAAIDFKVLRVVIQPYVPPEVSFAIEIEFTFINQVRATANNDSTISRNNFDNNKTVKLTLAAPYIGVSWDTNSISWRIGGISDANIASHVTNNELTITNGGVFKPILAGNSFNVTVNAALDGVPYSATVPITVTN